MNPQDVDDLKTAIALIRKVAESASQSAVKVVALNHARSFAFLAEQLENQGSRMWAAEQRGDQPAGLVDRDVSEYFNSEQENGK